MTEKQIVASEKELQNYFRIHPRLNLEFKALMSRLLREHRIDVTPETLSRLSVCLDRTGADKESVPTAGAVSFSPLEDDDVFEPSNDKEPPSLLESEAKEAEAEINWEPEIDIDLDGETESEGIPTKDMP